MCQIFAGRCAAKADKKAKHQSVAGCLCRRPFSSSAFVISAPPGIAPIMDVTDAGSRKLQAHSLQKTTFIIPTWCDMCSGILAGHGYQCKGPCRWRCHLGLGDGTQNCKADMLMKPCEAGAPKAHGKYKFGNLTRQFVRDARQTVKNVITREAVKEQEKFRTFDKLKDHAQAVKSQWDDWKVLMFFMVFEVVAVFAMVSLTFLSLLLCQGQLKTLRLGSVLAAWSVAAMAVHQFAVLILMRMTFVGLIRYSDLVHAFVHEILLIDLQELDVDVDAAASAVVRVVDRALAIVGMLGGVSLALWVASVSNSSAG